MKFILFLMWFVFLSGCSATNVHLYARYLSDAQKQEIVQILEKEQLNVSVNQLEFPKKVTETSLVYSPFILQRSTVPKIEMLMYNSEWPISRIEALVAGEHWFKKNSIGLFIVPEGVTPHDGKSNVDVANTYTSEHCSKSIDLILNLDGTYRFSEEIGNESYNFGQSGKWRMRTFPYVEMQPENKGRWLYFEVLKEAIQDKVSMVNTVTLQPLEPYEGFENCKFVFGERY